MKKLRSQTLKSVQLRLECQLVEMKVLILNLFVAFYTVSAVDIKCTLEHDVDGYNCRMLNIFSEANQVVTSQNGIWRKTFPVEVLHVQEESTTSFLPIKSCSFFPSLKKFDVYSPTLKELSRNVFFDCTKVTKVNIHNSLISWLPEDVFSDLVSLVHLEMMENKLDYMPKNIFSKNSKLREVNFNKNQLAIINADFPSSLTLLSLNGNFCIDKRYPGDFSNISSMLSDCFQRCTYSGFTNRVNSLEQAVLHNENLTATMLNLRSEKENVSKRAEIQALTIDELNQNLTRYELNISKMSIENVEKSIEIKLLRSNHSEAQAEMEELIEEIISLKLNISRAELELSDKNENIKICSTEKNLLNNNVRTLKSTLSALVIHNEAMEKNFAELQQFKNAFNVTVKELNLGLVEAHGNLSALQEINAKLRARIFENELNFTEVSDYCSSVINDLMKVTNETLKNLTISEESNKELKEKILNLIQPAQSFMSQNLLLNTSVAISCFLVVLLSFGWITTIIYCTRKTSPDEAAIIDMKTFQPQLTPSMFEQPEFHSCHN